MPAITRAEGAVEQDVWVGDVSALRQLVVRVEELATYVKNKLTALTDEQREERRAEFEENTSYLSDPERKAARWEAEEASRYAKITTNTAVEMEIERARWGMKLAGSPDEVIAGIEDVNDVTRVTLRFAEGVYANRAGYNLAVVISRKRGASASFTAPETEFIDLAGTRLKQEFRLRRPWYWWFRATWSIWTISLPGLIGSLIVSSWLLRIGASALAAGTGQVVFALIVIPLGYLLMQKIAKPFELVKEGDKGKAHRNLGRIASYFGWVAGSIIVPIVLSRLGF